MTVHVLILCTHNSARSVLAEGMLNHWAHKLCRDVQAHSAGSAPSGRINPFALEVLRNAGVDMSAARSKSWDEFSTEAAPTLAIVITVCDSAAAETCPVFHSAAGATGGGSASEITGLPHTGHSRTGASRECPHSRHCILIVKIH